jgi:hypothetical protein
MTLHDTPNVFIYYVLVVLMLESLLDIYCTGQFPVLKKIVFLGISS